jgi:hypothetical protein
MAAALVEENRVEVLRVVGAPLVELCASLQLPKSGLQPMPQYDDVEPLEIFSPLYAFHHYHATHQYPYFEQQLPNVEP